MGFSVPGLISIPADGDAHTVTIVEFQLPVVLQRFVVPHKDPRVQLQAKIVNTTEYVLIPGSASIYVDGSFVGTTKLGHINPSQRFECSMGFDPSIQVTYHPADVKVSHSGIVQKRTTRSLEQRITVRNLNSRPYPVDNLKVIDQVPVSQAGKIEVKIHNPPLGSKKDSQPVRVAPNVTAQWGTPDDGEEGAGSAGPVYVAVGQFSWSVTVPPQKALTLWASYEVTHPRDTVVYGI